MPSVKLVHIVTVPQSLGFIAGQVAYLKAKGFEVCAISSPGEWLDRFAGGEGVQACEVEMTRRVTVLRDLLALVELVRLLARLRPQIVHGHTPKGGLLGMMAAWVCRVPVRIYHVHGLPMLTAGGFRRLLLRWAEMISCRLSHEVLCVSHSLRDVVVQEGLCPSSKIKVLLAGSINGVDALGRFNPERAGDRLRTRLRFGIPANATVLGFVGRLVRDKGVIELSRAWQVLRDEHPGLHLLLVGPFETRDPVPREVKDRLVRDVRIHLVGEDWNTPPLYAAMDILVLPTYREGFGNVLLEAAAMGLPAVATRIPGCFDAVQHEVTGVLIPPRDATALADAIRRYLVDPGLRQRHGTAGRERVLRDFRPEAMWEAVYLEYLRLLGPSGAKTPGPSSADQDRETRAGRLDAA